MLPRRRYFLRSSLSTASLFLQDESDPARSAFFGLEPHTAMEKVLATLYYTLGDSSCYGMTLLLVAPLRLSSKKKRKDDTSSGLLS